MRVAILQSSYIPWKGYFDLIRSVDLFVWFDDVQYTTRDWRNRNRIKTSDGPNWLSIPCNGRQSMQIDEVRIADDGWRDRHWAAIERSYGDLPGFDWCRDVLHDLYRPDGEVSLCRVTRRFVEVIARELLSIETRFDDSVNYPSEARGQHRLLQILGEVGATSYLSGPAAKAYIDQSLFTERGVEVDWMDYGGYPEYSQPHGPFDHHVSIVDLLACTGPEAVCKLDRGS